MNQEMSIAQVVAAVDAFKSANPLMKRDDMKWIQFAYAIEWADKMMVRLDVAMRAATEPKKVVELEALIEQWRSSKTMCVAGIGMLSDGKSVN
jgi:hypothetical protein